MQAWIDMVECKVLMEVKLVHNQYLLHKSLKLQMKQRLSYIYT